MSNRPPCPRGLEEKLKREVHYKCPICGAGLPLLCAHTTKEYSEVGYNYDYLLAICRTCEEKVGKGTIDRKILDVIKKRIRTSISNTNRSTPFQIPYLISNNVYLGNNFISSTNTIISFSNLPMIWLEEINGCRMLSARFFDIKGTVVTGIDKNQWTADRERFYDFKIVHKDNCIDLKLIGKRDDMKIELSIYPDKLVVHKSIFYVPKLKIEILENGDLLIGSNKLSNNTFSNCGAAICIGIE